MPRAGFEQSDVRGNAPSSSPARSPAEFGGPLAYAPRLDRAGILTFQRSAGNRAVARLLARSTDRRRVLARWRIKPHLESPDLDNQRLQQAVTSADLALNVGVDDGQAVSLLQGALRKLGYNAPDTGTFDAGTQKAVAAFQAREGIPYPTGRQAGPKTLSTLDDALLRLRKPEPKPEPKPRKDCARYEPKERETSWNTRGGVSRDDAFGKTLTLYNFGAGRSGMKEAHEKAVDQLISDFSLYDPESQWEVEFIRGFTDSVDAEDRNWMLREARAIDVQFYLQHHGVPGAPDGKAADINSYDPGCTPAGRTAARRVVVRLKKRKPKVPCDPQRVADARKSVASAEAALGAAQARLARARADEVRVMVARAACGLMGPNKGAEECYKAQYPEQQRVAKELAAAPIAIRAAEQNLSRARAELRAAEQEAC